VISGLDPHDPGARTGSRSPTRSRPTPP
jgi:hypothetical protein